MYDLHLGMTPDTFDRWLTRSDLPVGTDEDGWNVWGEAPGTDDNDSTTLHVIVQSASRFMLTALAAYLIDEHSGSLVPMGGHDAQIGTLTVITAHDDWSVVLESRFF